MTLEKYRLIFKYYSLSKVNNSTRVLCLFTERARTLFASRVERVMDRLCAAAERALSPAAMYIIK
jgi:hypothetical protein